MKFFTAHATKIATILGIPLGRSLFQKETCHFFYLHFLFRELCVAESITGRSMASTAKKKILFSFFFLNVVVAVVVALAVFFFFLPPSWWLLLFVFFSFRLSLKWRGDGRDEANQIGQAIDGGRSGSHCNPSR